MQHESRVVSQLGEAGSFAVSCRRRTAKRVFSCWRWRAVGRVSRVGAHIAIRETIGEAGNEHASRSERRVDPTVDKTMMEAPLWEYGNGAIWWQSEQAVEVGMRRALLANRVLGVGVGVFVLVLFLYVQILLSPPFIFARATACTSVAGAPWIHLCTRADGPDSKTCASA